MIGLRLKVKNESNFESQLLNKKNKKLKMEKLLLRNNVNCMVELLISMEAVKHTLTVCESGSVPNYCECSYQ